MTLAPLSRIFCCIAVSTRPGAMATVTMSGSSAARYVASVFVAALDVPYAAHDACAPTEAPVEVKTMCPLLCRRWGIAGLTYEAGQVCYLLALRSRYMES
jgi:hypothetical protein